MNLKQLEPEQIPDAIKIKLNIMQKQITIRSTSSLNDWEFLKISIKNLTIQYVKGTIPAIAISLVIGENAVFFCFWVLKIIDTPIKINAKPISVGYSNIELKINLIEIVPSEISGMLYLILL